MPGGKHHFISILFFKTFWFGESNYNRTDVPYNLKLNTSFYLFYHAKLSSTGSNLYLSVSVPVLALLPDPVDGVEVLIGAHTRQRVFQRVHQLTGGAPVHPGSSAAAAAAAAGDVFVIISWWARGGKR